MQKGTYRYLIISKQTNPFNAKIYNPMLKILMSDLLKAINQFIEFMILSSSIKTKVIKMLNYSRDI